jgi:hypothetical protein
MVERVRGSSHHLCLLIRLKGALLKLESVGSELSSVHAEVGALLDNFELRGHLFEVVNLVFEVEEVVSVLAASALDVLRLVLNQTVQLVYPLVQDSCPDLVERLQLTH